MASTFSVSQTKVVCRGPRRRTVGPPRRSTGCPASAHRAYLDLAVGNRRFSPCFPLQRPLVESFPPLTAYHFFYLVPGWPILIDDLPFPGLPTSRGCLPLFLLSTAVRVQDVLLRGALSSLGFCTPSCRLRARTSAHHHRSGANLGFLAVLPPHLEGPTFHNYQKDFV